MIVRKELDPGRKLTDEEIEMLEKLKDRPIVYDEDSPYFTYEELKRMLELTEKMKKGRKKEVVTLRLSTYSLNKAKSLGKGYTSVLSRILEDALRDPEVISRYL